MDTPIDNNLHQKLDEVYTKIDILLKDNRFKDIDDIFKIALTVDDCADTALALLISTYPCKNEFKNRASFMQTLHDLYTSQGKDVESLLYGL